MKSIDDLLLPYAELETAVRDLTVHLFSDICGLCTACCCRADICEEAIHGAFLNQLLERQGLAAENMDERFGWLDLHGCSLEYGRPPICYAYYCDELMERLPNGEARLAVRTLGQLMHHVGRNALGTRHLVEVVAAEDLAKVDLDGLSQRLEEAQAAFEVLGHFFQSGRLGTGDRETLSAITTEEP